MYFLDRDALEYTVMPSTRLRCTELRLCQTHRRYLYNLYRSDLVTYSNFGRISHTVFEILTLKDRKPLFGAPLRGNPLEFPDETYPTKIKGWGYRMVKIS